MKLNVQQAIYGEKNNAHKLITYKGYDTEVIEEIYRFTDIPALLPQGMVWEPYYTGLPYKNYYLLSKTFSDESAQRKGMVLTHVLLFKLNEIIQLHDLRPLFAMLPVEASREINSSASEIQLPNNQPRIINPKRFLGVAAKLLDASESLPVVWSGQDNFQELISVLWANFPAAVRKTFSFGMSFIPDDLTDRELTVVSAITSKASKYNNRSIIKETPDEISANPIEAYMLGLEDSAQISALINKIESEVESLAQLQLIATTQNSIQKIDNNDPISFTETLSLIRLLEILAPADDKGITLKQSAIKKFSDLVKNASFEEVRKLRNLQLKGFLNQKKELVKVLVGWFAKNLNSLKIDTSDLETTFLDLIVEKSGILSEAAISFLDSQTNNVAFLTSLIWKLWENRQGKVDSFDKWIVNDKEFELEFAKRCPLKISTELGEDLAAWSAKRNWLLLHLTILVSFSSLTEAILRQFKINKKKFKKEWLNFLLGRVTNKAFVQSAVEIDNPDLLQIAAEICISEPKILDSLDLSKTGSQKLWLLTYKKSGDLWKGIDEPFKKVFSLVDLLIKGKEIESELLFAISTSDYANLTLYPKRSEVWKFFEYNVKENFLMTTATGWLNYFSSKDWKDETVESELENIVTDYTFFQRYLGEAIGKAPAILIKFYRHFTFLNEYRFDRDLIFIEKNLRKISFVDSADIGELLNEREWQNSANRIADDIIWWDRKDLIPAANKCKRLMNRINRGIAWLNDSFEAEAVTEDEWWDMFEDKIADLYPSGPQDDEIWSRAKGKKKILDNNGTGEERWHKVLRLLRNGGGGKNISARSLLKLVLEKYDQGDLKILLDLAKKLNIP